MGGILGSMSFGRIRFRTWVWVDFRFSFVFAQWGIGVEGDTLILDCVFVTGWLLGWTCSSLFVLDLGCVEGDG